MLNTRDLEKRWLRYKIKSVLLPSTIIVLSLATISIFSFLYFSDKEQEDINILNDQKQLLTQVKVNNNIQREITQNIAPQKTPEISNVIDTHVELNKTNFEQKTTSTKKVVLKPSLEFIKNIEESSDGYYHNIPEEETFNTAYVDPKPKKNVQQKTDADEENEVVITSEKPKKIVIAKETNMEDIKDAEKRFKQNNNPALSLFLAKQYYAKGDYSKSYNYALKTNQLDKDNEDSWLIFSRSLVKLGKPDLAKKALKEYIKYSHSSNAQLLLDDIMTGKFQ
ncbi:tetratricopeptide repeat protein [Sulfurimonas sp.]|uniref:tetratricopeptide repeat protein n=1 Tax=Sulfurimonas sp. TaxID=2022749 RepID=UPI003D137FFB